MWFLPPPLSPQVSIYTERSSLLWKAPDALELLRVASTLAAEMADGRTPAQAAALRRLSQGKRQKEIAMLLGISISAVKARLKSAAQRLGASTPIEAASIAASGGML